MSSPKSLRLEDSLIKEIEKFAAKNENSFNNQVVEILKAYFNNAQEMQITIEDESYYPIHLTNEELILIMDEFISNFSDGRNCSVSVRKDGGGKGIDFQVNFFSEHKSQTIRKKRYNFAINAHWKLENTFEHWIEDSHGGYKKSQELCKRLNDLKIFTINNVIEENTNQNNIPELNPIFKDDTWKVLFERKYPILKVV
jgi:hypothetical protein